MTGEILLQIVMAMIGALGFGLLFHISGSRLITIMLGAAVNWGVYLLAMQWYDNRVTAFFVSTLATAALAELLARLLKAPVITLLVPMLVPLIPGGDLYYTTLALVQGDTAGFARYGTLFIEEAGAMAFGVILRRINGDGHNVDIARSIGNTHAPDDIAAVLMQQGIEPFHRIRVLYHDSHYGNSCLHKNTSE